MARVLTATFLTAMALVGLFIVAVPGHATTWYSGKTSTGCAFGSYTGQGSGQLTIGHFANHYAPYCPADPAASWGNGTWITGFSPAPTMYQGDGSVVYPSAFELHDIGDAYCVRSNYWVDLYFGRYKNPWDSCSCYNATEYCYTGYNYVNNCQDASAWGVQTVGYYGP
jgi:hypothetical protein